MQILSIEDRPGASTGDARRLRTLGHVVSRCHGVADRPFPCSGLTGACPLDRSAGIDLVVDSRSSTATAATASEAGAVCGLQRQIPVLVRGDVDPFPGWSVVQRDDEPLQAACERAVEVEAAARASVVEDEVARILVAHGTDAPRPSVRVERSGRRTHIVVHVAAPVERTLRGAIATRVHAIHAAGGTTDVLEISVLGTDDA